MLWVLLSCVSQKFIGLFVFFLLLCQWGVTPTGRDHSWDRWPQLAKWLFHTIEHHAPCMNWRSYLEGSDLGRGAGIGGQVVSNYIVHQLFRWVLSFLFLISLLLLLAMLLHFTLFSIIKLLFSQPTNFTSGSPPHSTRVGEKRRGLSGFVGLNFHLGLAHAPVLQILPCLHCPPLPQLRWVVACWALCHFQQKDEVRNVAWWAAGSCLAKPNQPCACTCSNYFKV